MSELLSESFLSKYREIKHTPLSNIGEFVYLRTYSRYLNNKKEEKLGLKQFLEQQNITLNLV